MPENTNDTDGVTLLLKLLRALRGWGQAELAEAAGVDPSSIQRYEGGRTIPPRKTVERLVAAVGLPMAFVEACLLPALRAARALLAAEGTETAENSSDLPDDLDRTLVAAAQGAIAASIGSDQPRFPQPWPMQTEPVPEDRLVAGDAWERLRSCTKPERLFLVERAPEFRTWAVAERLCLESMAAAADNADRAIELAELGVHVATLSGGGEAWRSSLEGFALAFLANALRVRNDFAKAEERIGEAWERWRRGKKTELLSVSRLYTSEAGLRQAQGQFSEGLERIDSALSMAPAEQLGGVLLTKAIILERKGDVEQSVEVLREAEAVLDSEHEPRLFYALRFNLAVCLLKLARHADTADLMAEIREAAGLLQNSLDSIRVIWLDGRIAAEMGHFAEARSKFEYIYSEFATRGLDAECYLVAQELNALPTPSEAAVTELETIRHTEPSALEPTNRAVVR